MESYKKKKYHYRTPLLLSLLLVFLFALMIVPLTSAGLPRVIYSSVVNNQTTDSSNMFMPTVNGLFQDLIFMNIGGRDSASFTFTAVDPAFLHGGQSGTTRVSDVWFKLLEADESVNASAQGSTIIDRAMGHGGIIRGANEDYLVQITNSVAQNSINNATINITTQRNNSLIMIVIGMGQNQTLDVVDGELVYHNFQNSATSGMNLITITKNATTAGAYRIGASWVNATATSFVIMEIASESNGTVTPSAFAAENVTSNNLQQFSTALMNSSRVNILWMGDSLSVPVTQLDVRWPYGFLRNFNHSTGYYSISAGAGAPINGLVITRSDLATYGPNSSINTYATTADFWGDGTFFGSLWHGKDLVMKMGNDFVGEEPSGNVLKWNVNATLLFPEGRTTDWMTGSPLSMQMGYLYDNNISYAVNFTLGNGTGDGTIFRDYNVTNTSIIVGGVLHNRALNLVKDRIRLDSTNPSLYLSRVRGNTTLRYFDSAVVKLYKEDNPNGVEFGTLAQASVSYNNFVQNASATSSSKRYLQLDLANYLSQMYNRTSADNFVFIAMGAESGSTESQIDKVHAIIGNLTEAYTMAGLATPRFALVSTWRTFDNNASRVQAEVFYNVSTTRSNVAFISIYGLSNGILLNGSNAAQGAWAIQNNYTNISLNNGELFNASVELIDNNDGVHQKGERAAFFFAYMLNNLIVENSSIGAGAGTNSTTTPVLTNTGLCSTVASGIMNFSNSLVTVFTIFGVIVILGLIGFVFFYISNGFQGGGEGIGIGLDLGPMIIIGIFIFIIIAFVALLGIGMLCLV